MGVVWIVGCIVGCIVGWIVGLVVGMRSEKMTDSDYGHPDRFEVFFSH